MDTWAWSSPLGLGAFILAIGFTIGLLCWSISRLAAIGTQDAKTARRGR